jgi:hypothetical protein
MRYALELEAKRFRCSCQHSTAVLCPSAGRHAYCTAASVLLVSSLSDHENLISCCMLYSPDWNVIDLYYGRLAAMSAKAKGRHRSSSL